MAEPTAGEWKFRETSIVTDEYYIATLDSGEYSVPEKEWVANGYLLAAAKELLVAQQACLDDAVERGADLDCPPWPEVIAALAKARGEK